MRPIRNEMIHRPISKALVAGLLLLVAAAGCEQEIITDYGTRTGGSAGSVNGTTVLGDLLVDAGHQVRSWRSLSPSLEKVDVILWAPDEFGLPRPEVQAWLEHWLQAGDRSRHLIFIGRGYDAEITYWQSIEPLGSQTQQKEVARRLARARHSFNTHLRAASTQQSWGNRFQWEPEVKTTRVKKIGGPWARQIDQAGLQINRSGRLTPISTKAKVLLRGDRKSLVYQFNVQRSGPASRLTVIDNGAFLLNVPLVRHEHRKLAGRLVKEIGSDPKRIVFLESGSEGVPIREHDSDGRVPTGMSLFSLWPISGVLFHLALLGMIFALSRWPIFGTPRRLPQPSLTDFGRHVRALGAMLAQSGDSTFARKSLETYRGRLRD
jgi:hypothetical protein